LRRYDSSPIGGTLVGKCPYCGKDAGLLRNAHKECKDVNEHGRHEIIQIFSENATNTPIDSFKGSILAVASASFINEDSLRKLEIEGWEKAVAKSLEDGIPTSEEEKSLVNCAQAFGLDQELDTNGAFSKLVKAAVIRELLEGKIPHRVRIDGPLPFNLQKGEEIVWLFKSVRYYEERTFTRRVGSYSGASVRVAKGLYFGTGGFRSYPVVTISKTLADVGRLALTEKQLYFAGTRKAFRVAYSKIVAFRPYRDGIGIQRDAQSAKPQLFGVDDGWFIYNLATNLAILGKV
jgi:hypothetical protein